MKHRFLLGLLLLIFSWPVTVQASSDENWLFDQLRIWASPPQGHTAAWNGETSAGVAGHPEIAPSDPLYKKLTSLFSRHSGVVAATKPPELPLGKLVWWDVDRDGKKEIVFAGGASPDPYFVILKATGDKWQVWQDCRGRLLSIFNQDNKVILIAAIDAYGVERDNALDIKICNPREPGNKAECTFRWVGELTGLARQGSAANCTTIRATALRTSPEVDNVPDESGMGFDWPGNLYQELGQGSSGWLLDKTRNRRGEQWSLVAFLDPAEAADAEKLLKAISSPKKVGRSSPPGYSPKHEFIVGWVKTRDLNGL